MDQIPGEIHPGITAGKILDIGGIAVATFLSAPTPRRRNNNPDDDSVTISNEACAVPYHLARPTLPSSLIRTDLVVSSSGLDGVGTERPLDHGLGAPGVYSRSHDEDDRMTLDGVGWDGIVELLSELSDAKKSNGWIGILCAIHAECHDATMSDLF